MKDLRLFNDLRRRLLGRTAIVTGGANGIGAQTVLLLRHCGANVIIADVESSKQAANRLMDSMDAEHRRHLHFVSVDISKWADVQNMFLETDKQYGPPDLVVANAGIMEHSNVLDLEDVGEQGELLEPHDAYRVIDVNLKGTLNTLKLAMFHMKNKNSSPHNPDSGSIVLVSSTSGYFGGSAVAAYVASKHGIVGLTRSSQVAANKIGIRVNSVAPFFTPSHLTSSYASDWTAAGLQVNTQQDVALAIVEMLTDPTQRGSCSLVSQPGSFLTRLGSWTDPVIKSQQVAGGKVTEIEHKRTALLPDWIGNDNVQLMDGANELFVKLGGYPLPKARRDGTTP